MGECKRSGGKFTGEQLTYFYKEAATDIYNLEESNPLDNKES